MPTANENRPHPDTPFHKILEQNVADANSGTVSGSNANVEFPSVEIPSLDDMIAKHVAHHLSQRQGTNQATKAEGQPIMSVADSIAQKIGQLRERLLSVSRPNYDQQQPDHVAPQGMPDSDLRNILNYIERELTEIINQIDL